MSFTGMGGAIGRKKSCSFVSRTKQFLVVPLLTEPGGKHLTAYGTFSDYQNETLPYFVMRLSGHQYTNGAAASMPENHLIPSLVRNVIGTPVK